MLSEKPRYLGVIDSLVVDLVAWIRITVSAVSVLVTAASESRLFSAGMLESDFL